MDYKERHQKTNEILDQFGERGKEFFKTSAMFNKCVQMMVRGVSKEDIILDIIQAQEDTQNAFNEYINRDYRPMRFEVH